MRDDFRKKRTVKEAMFGWTVEGEQVAVQAC